MTYILKKKCRELYFSIKEAMEKAVSRLNDAIGTTANLPNLSELGGEFQILDLKTNMHGVLEICMEGIGLVFNEEKVISIFFKLNKFFKSKHFIIITFLKFKKEFIDLKRVRKCTTQKDDTFVLEEYGKKI